MLKSMKTKTTACIYHAPTKYEVQITNKTITIELDISAAGVLFSLKERGFVALLLSMMSVELQ